MEDPHPHTFSPQKPTFKKHLTKLPFFLHSLDSVEAAVARYHQEARGVSFGILRDAMAKRALCKFFARGACLKGEEHCEFSHDWKPPPNNICNFHQKGVCAYGNHCRYEHVKVAQSYSSAPLSSDSEGVAPDETSESLYSHITTAWGGNSGHHDVQDAEDQSICSFAARCYCPRGVNCPICGKQCLHPFIPEEREEHLTTCEKRHKHLDALKCSQEIECGICLERVLSKPTSAERKFGILSECDHTFCISCIRNWRSSSPSSGLNVNSALRSCPMCRKLSYFVIPSVIWYSSKDEKQAITESYKAKLRTINCKHFDFGNGTCPFRTSCFYRHANCDDGSPEEVILRPLGAEDSNMVVAKSIRLSDQFS